MKYEILLLLFGFASVIAEDSSVSLEADVMRQLPGAEPFPYNAYSGYLTVTDTKALHYVFVQSKTSPTTDPVLLWFNGGPGCSSLLGFFQEHGPWIIDDGESFIKENPYPWNERANVVYIENYAGVGFSTATGPDDLKQDDQSQSVDLYIALDSFYKKFPTFLKNDLYISGESYAGIYVPFLAWQIHQHNLQAPTDSSITPMNLKGYLVGNGVTDYRFDGDPTFPATVAGFSIVPPAVYNNYTAHNCYYTIDGLLTQNTSAICDELYQKINGYAANLNWYDLFRAVQPLGSLLQDKNRLGSVQIGGVTKTYRRGHTLQEYTPWLKKGHNLQSPLLGDYLSDYVNSNETRAALNIPDAVQGWNSCGSDVDYTMLPEGSYWIYIQLKGKYRMLKYSGDTDGAVPTLGTKQWISRLNWPITEIWRQWFTDGQVSGSIQRYEDLDFVTVHGVGHMCPQWKRKDTSNMILSWIHGETF